MTATELIQHWSFKLAGLGLISATALVCLAIILLQIWLIFYYNPWGFALFPLANTMRILMFVIFTIMGVTFGAMFWNMSLKI